MAYLQNRDYYLIHAIDIIKADFGHVVSVEQKNKDLNKFGFTNQCQTTETELQRLPTGVFSETYVNQNLITTISSDAAADVMIVTIEGHTVGSIISVSTLTQAAGIATCTTGAAHGGVTGDWVYMEGAVQTGYNGIVQITVVSTTIFTYKVDAATISPATGTITTTNQNKTFVSQNATLNGTTQVTLTTPLARATRMFVPQQNRAVDLVGSVYVYENDTTTAGVPDTPALVHLMNGDDGAINSSLKANTSLSSTDYWIVNSMQAHFREKAAGYATIIMQVRNVGGVWREIDDLEVSSNLNTADLPFKPYVIIPPNSDIRLIATCDVNNKDVGGSIEGVLAIII